MNLQSHKTQRIKNKCSQFRLKIYHLLLASKYEIFQIATKSDKAVYLGKLIEMNEVVIDF
jgi:hypothetical protein